MDCWKRRLIPDKLLSAVDNSAGQSLIANTYVQTAVPGTAMLSSVAAAAMEMQCPENQRLVASQAEFVALAAGIAAVIELAGRTPGCETSLQTCTHDSQQIVTVLTNEYKKSL